jgi:predicted metalloendopeptidase
LPKKYKEAKLEFDKINLGSNSIPERSKTCANAVLDIMPYAVGRLYVENNFDEASKEAVNLKILKIIYLNKNKMCDNYKASVMIENIRKEFKVIVSELKWMDGGSQEKAKEKADFIEKKIGYPEFTYNNTYLNMIYKEVSI